MNFLRIVLHYAKYVIKMAGNIVLIMIGIKENAAIMIQMMIKINMIHVVLIILYALVTFRALNKEIGTRE